MCENSSKHTPGPWRAEPYDCHAETSILSYAQIPKEVGGLPTVPGPFVIAECSCSFGSDIDEANAARIVACVNVCEGVHSDAFAELPGGSLNGLLTAVQQMVKEHKALKESHAKLLAGFKSFYADKADPNGRPGGSSFRANECIAEAEGA